MISSVPACPLERKSLGAWYTPETIIRPLVGWAVRRGDLRVLDPSCGDGGFLAGAARRIHAFGGGVRSGGLLGFDVNPQAVAATVALLTGEQVDDSGMDVRVGDFFDVVPPDGPGVDAVVGNPPYIRYQSFSGESRALALQRARSAGVRLTQLCSSWAPFVVHATGFLRRGGRLGLVLPEELIHASYAREVRGFLRRAFRSVSLIRFEGHLFPESQERVVLLLAEGRGEEPAGELRLASIAGPEDIRDLRDVVRAAEAFAPGVSPDKWEPGFHDSASNILDALRDQRRLVSLSTVGKAGIGFVSGANDFFILTTAEAAARRIPASLLRSAITSARQIPGAELTTREIGERRRDGAQCLLWDGRGAHRKALAAYIHDGVVRGISSRYKCRARDPWYRVPGVIVPHAFITYMSDAFPRLVLNRGRATCSNTLLAISLGGMPAAERAAFVVSFYNSATMLAAERIGRRYGGGVLKLEPSEADRLLVPAPSVLSGLPALGAFLPRIDSLLRSRRYEDVLKLGDGLILEKHLGLSATEVRVIQDSLKKRREQRLGSAKRARTRRSDLQLGVFESSAEVEEHAPQT